ncbi:MAG: hypothetical protein HY647_09730, partial [Acidobacteria bacterium]|nr:hypothetical protein [Acidobacteriota bacterium]
MVLRWTSFAVFVVLASTLHAAIDYQAARQERRLKAVKVIEKVTIDGRLDEPVWSQAPVANNFIQNEPRPDEPASETTEVRVLYDQYNLYFGIYALDSKPDLLIIRELKKDFISGLG